MYLLDNTNFCKMLPDLQVKRHLRFLVWLYIFAVFYYGKRGGGGNKKQRVLLTPLYPWRITEACLWVVWTHLHQPSGERHFFPVLWVLNLEAAAKKSANSWPFEGKESNSNDFSKTFLISFERRHKYNLHYIATLVVVVATGQTVAGGSDASQTTWWFGLDWNLLILISTTASDVYLFMVASTSLEIRGTAVASGKHASLSS